VSVRFLPYLLAFVLGTGAAGLVACGSGTASKALIPSADAGPLKTEFDDVAAAVSNGDCPGATQALNHAQAHLDSLPGSTSVRLRRRLQSGISSLRSQAQEECVAAQTQTDTVPTTTEPATTDTTTTETTPTDTTTTDTTPTDTTTTPGDTTATPPPAAVPPPATTPDQTGGTTTP
jgi:hypothetical protein